MTCKDIRDLLLWLVIPITLAAIVIFAPLPAFSQAACMAKIPADRALKYHTDQGHEPRHSGVISDNAQFTVFVADDGRWFFVQFFTSGMACLVAVGTDWETHEAKPAGLPL